MSKYLNRLPDVKIEAVPIRTELLAMSEKASGSFLGAAAGGLLLGPIGAVAGAMSGKVKQFATFYVKWSDGHTSTEQVQVGSSKYNQYMKLRK